MAHDTPQTDADVETEYTRRSVLGTLAVLPLGIFDWLFGDDSESEDVQPYQQIGAYPARHGADVDTPPNAHHTPPTVPEPGAYLETTNDVLDLLLTPETDTWTMAAASSGTHSYSFGGTYKQVTKDIRVPASGGSLSDISVVLDEWVTDADGNFTGAKISWNNGTTAETSGTIEILGFG